MSWMRLAQDPHQFCSHRFGCHVVSLQYRQILLDAVALIQYIRPENGAPTRFYHELDARVALLKLTPGIECGGTMTDYEAVIFLIALLDRSCYAQPVLRTDIGADEDMLTEEMYTPLGTFRE